MNSSQILALLKKHEETKSLIIDQSFALDAMNKFNKGLIDNGIPSKHNFFNRKVELTNNWSNFFKIKHELEEQYQTATFNELEESMNNKRKGGGDSDNSTDNTTNKIPNNNNNNNDVNGILRVIISNKFTDNSYIILLLFGLLFLFLFLFIFTFVLLAFFQLGYI